MPGQQYTPGQRWISDSEPNLGLGTVAETAGRTVTLAFPASGERRIFARENAPLTRVRFTPGDQVELADGTPVRIEQVRQQDGLLVYLCRDNGQRPIRLPESELSHYLTFNRPQARLLGGQLDEEHWFRLRHASLAHYERLERSDLRGLGGARTELLPHQLYIAHEVGRRPAPRVLLADEVGLGKTIEACLILHRQLLTGQAVRILVIVPSPLLHQWLVELMRRFNLHFSLFDEARCRAVEESGEAANPFLSEQLVLCGTELLLERPLRLQQALEGEWDTLVVDEAHHLEWGEGQASPAYRAIEALAECTPGLLLLTATPEQLGSAGHFARLRLLDPDRFFSLQAFSEEERLYQPVAEAAAHLIAGDPLPRAGARKLLDLLGESSALPLLERLEELAVRERLIELLLDRHGTGRVLFRNTRSHIKGFSPRRLHPYPLPLPDAYLPSPDDYATRPSERLCPERLNPNPGGKPWWRIDPRVEWLINTLHRLGGEKLLVICVHRDTAIGLAQALRTRSGINAALFHEGMSILERDRAAAWFADPEQGARLMICSEIGSEGRNFQFAHHLALFDLPADPNLLEQRIGRLDRIGQQETVHIHVPYFEQGAHAVLLRWYDEGLGAFTATCHAGQEILSRLRPALNQAMEEAEEEPEAVELLLRTTRSLHAEIDRQMKNGRDQLLELHSCRPDAAERIRDAIQAAERQGELAGYMETIFAAYGVETEYHSLHSLIVRPGAGMVVEHFPGLAEEGLTVTFDRRTALVHEDRHYLTWEHPMVLGCLEMVLESGIGNSCVAAVSHPAVPAGSLLLELLFVLECPAPRALQAGRFMPASLFRILVDQSLREPETEPGQESIDRHLQPLERATARRIITPLRPLIERMIARGEELAEKRHPPVIRSALAAMQRHYRGEVERLQALRQVNPNIRQTEIDALLAQREELAAHFANARIRLDALRLLIGI